MFYLILHLQPLFFLFESTNTENIKNFKTNPIIKNCLTMFNQHLIIQTQINPLTKL